MKKNDYSRYRSHRQINSRRNSATESTSGIYETIFLQCCICGLILGGLLLVCTIRTDFTEQLRHNLKMAVSGTATFADISDTAVDAGNFFSGFVGSPIDSEEENKSDPGGLESLIPGEATEVFAVPSEFRIDEDILAEMGSRTDPYGETTEKKSEVPEPTPEPIH